jgi:hypothetical protein
VSAAIDQVGRRRGLSPIAVTSTQLLPAASGEKKLGNRVVVEREAGGTETVRVRAQVEAPNAGGAERAGSGNCRDGADPSPRLRT